MTVQISRVNPVTFLSRQVSCVCLQYRCRSRQAATGRCRGLQVHALFGGGNKEGGGGGNPFAKLGDMKNLMDNMKKAQQLVQVEAARVQEELARTEFEGYSSDETVRVVMTGNQEPQSVEFTEEAMEVGAEKLAELTIQAMKDAHTKSVAGMKQRMQTLAGSLGIGNGQNPLGM